MGNAMQNEQEKCNPPAGDVQEALSRYGDMLFRICFVLLRQRQDAEDAVQETLLRYLRKAPRFESEQHEKAWLIRVTTNICKNELRFRSRHETVSSEELAAFAAPAADDGALLRALCDLPYIYRVVLQLYYVEGYKTAEIAQFLHISLSAVKKRLEKGRNLLKQAYTREDSE